jgi:glucose/arabinose dehydrogenase
MTFFQRSPSSSIAPFSAKIEARSRRSRVLATLLGGLLASTACGDDSSDSEEPDASLPDAATSDDPSDDTVTDTDSTDEPGTSEPDTIDDTTATDTDADSGVHADSGAENDAGPSTLDGGVTSDGGQSEEVDASYPDGSVITPDPTVFRPEEIEATAELMHSLELPEGFELSVYAENLGKPRMLATWGDQVYLTRPEEGDVLRFSAPDGTGPAASRATVLAGVPLVHGIVFRDDTVYLATDTQVLTAAVTAEGDFEAPTVLIDDLPEGGQHPYRTLGIGPDDALYISVGSSCDACAETNLEHATILRSTLDGTERSTFASGLRNTIGFDWHPVTGELWGMDHGSDNRGDDTPPEELNWITQGANYGWPYCFGNQQIDLIIDEPVDTTKEALCPTTSPASLVTQAHNAPIGLTFYDADVFPEEYRNDAFVAMHGSWNRLPATGYKVVRIEFDSDGNPVEFHDFVSGFLVNEGTETFGRPAGITVAQDGSLLFTDDSGGVIYRVGYTVDEEGDAGTAADAGADAGSANSDEAGVDGGN